MWSQTGHLGWVASAGTVWLSQDTGSVFYLWGLEHVTWTSFAHLWNGLTQLTNKDVYGKIIPYKKSSPTLKNCVIFAEKLNSCSPMGWLVWKNPSSQQVWFCMNIFTLHLASFCFLLQECSCQRQSHLTSKYSVTDVNEDRIIFCVTQRVFLLPRKTRHQSSSGYAQPSQSREMRLVLFLLQLPLYRIFLT